MKPYFPETTMTCKCGKIAALGAWGGKWAEYECSCGESFETVRGLPIAPPERVDELHGALLALLQADGLADWEHACKRAREVLAK